MTDDIASLRQLVVSGEACPPGLVARWNRPDRQILNVYGPTEATVNTTAKVCRPDEPITIGRPITGYSTFVLDGEMRPLPSGTRGALCRWARRFARLPQQRELTSRCFVHSPHDGTRLYRTGDLAAINDDGELEFFGRIDDQVKIRGYRVELSEIASVLLEQDNVSSATVTTHIRDGVPTLAAYLVAQDRSKAIDRYALLSRLKAKLPAYMLPTYLDVLPELPMLTTGKVDRKRLPDPILPLLEEVTGQAMPTNPLQAKIADTWSAIFNVKNVGIDQDFFLDLGGHSLLAAQMVALLRSRANLHIAVRDVYAFSTVRKLAGHLAEVSTATVDVAPPEPMAMAPPLQRKFGFWVAALQAFLLVASWYLLSTPALFRGADRR